MCDELGDESNMEAYVVEAGNTYICSVKTKDRCSDKELTFLDVYMTKSAKEVADQLSRLEVMMSKSSTMKADLKTWIRQRIGILKQLSLKATDTSVGTNEEL